MSWQLETAWAWLILVEAFSLIGDCNYNSTKILKGHRYISNMVYAMTLQLWHPVFSRCFDKFQQNLQEVLSEIQFTMSCENELCPGPIGIHGLKNKNWKFLKFIWKIKVCSISSEIPPKHVVCPSNTLINMCTFHCVQILIKISFRSKKKNFWKISFFVKTNVF